MKFSCDRCGQRYSSADEPEAGHSYRVLCLACGGMVLLKGGEFPALPTFAAGPAMEATAVPDARAEEPVLLALAPMAQRDPLRDPPAEDRRRLPDIVPAARGVLARRLIRFSAAAGVAAATVGAGALLVLGGPRPAVSGDATLDGGGSETMTAIVGGTAAPSARPSSSAQAVVAPAAPPQDRKGPASVATPAAKAPVGGAPASPPSASRRTPSASPAGAGPVASPKAASSPAGKASSAPGPGAAAPRPRDAASQGPPGVPSGSAGQPTPEEVAAAVAAKRPAFQACAQEALRNEPALVAGGLSVTLVMTVNPIGITTAPRIDDPRLQDTDLDECLRSVVRRLVFPPFEGEPFQARIPLVLGK